MGERYTGKGNGRRKTFPLTVLLAKSINGIMRWYLHLYDRLLGTPEFNLWISEDCVLFMGI